MQTSPVSAVAGPRPNGVRSIEPELLFQRLVTGQRVLVLDVRDAKEVERSPQRRMSGARNIPVDQLFVRRNELPTAMGDAVVTISNEGVRSDAAAFTLSLLGFTNVRSLEGGLDAWVRKRLPLG